MLPSRGRTHERPPTGSHDTTLLIALVTAAPAADLISGVPYIVDGDTLSIGNLKIRLQGIDAPETDLP